MSRKRAKSKGKPRPKHTIWCREALSLARLMPPIETLAQACFCCGHSDAGFGIKLYEIYDTYGRLCLCEKCLLSHIKQLEDIDTAKHEPIVQKRLMTYEQWLLESTVEEMQDVLNRMKARLK